MRITNFQGEMPRTPDKKLPVNVALEAINCDTSDGQLKPVREPEETQLLPKPGELRSIFRCGSTWLSWLTETDVVKAEGIDTDNRIYYTGDGYPKVTDETLATSGGVPSAYPSEAYRLGVAAPVEALTVATDKIDPLEDYGAAYATVSYTYTYVSYINANYAEESAPAPPTPAIEVEGNMKVTLSNFVLPTGTGNNILYYRVYRTAVSSSGSAVFQLVPTGRDGSGNFTYDMPVAQTTFDDLDTESVPQAIYQNLSEQIPTEGWDNLPDEAFGLTQYQNGILAAIYDQSVLISEAFYPYAFPQGINDVTKDNSYPFEYYPREIASFRDMLIVGTDANPYVLTGSDPAFLTKTKLPFNEACKGPMVVTELGAVYPSRDGLVVCDGITVAPVSSDTWTKEQWQALGPENLKMFYYKDRLLGFFKGSGDGFSYDFKRTKTVEKISLDELGLTFYDGHLIEEDSKLYLLLKSGSLYYVYEWEGSSSSMDQTWEGYVHAKDRALESLVRIEGDFTEGSMDLTLTVDGIELAPIEIENDEPYYLPAGYRYEDLQYKFVGKTLVDDIYIANSRGELYDQ